jgi:hypothetical protein
MIFDKNLLMAFDRCRKEMKQLFFVLEGLMYVYIPGRIYFSFHPELSFDGIWLAINYTLASILQVQYCIHRSDLASSARSSEIAIKLAKEGTSIHQI